MPYTKQTWVDNDPTKPLSAARMNVLETQHEQAVSDASADATAKVNTLKQSVDTKYTKPSTGIPESDLSSSVQGKLNSGGGSNPMRVYSVKDYGAVGDGVADDTNAIKSAITAAGTGGTVVFDGTFLISSTLLPRPDQKFVGASTGAVIKSAAGAAFNMIQAAWSTGAMTFENITLDGNKANVTGAGDTVGIGIYISTARTDRQTRINNVSVINSSSHGIRMLSGNATAAYPVSITGSMVINAARIGIFARFVSIECTFNRVSYSGAEGIYLDQCDYSEVSNNVSNYNIWHGIVSNYSSYFQVNNNICNFNGTVTGGNTASVGIAIGGGAVNRPVNNRYSLSGNVCSGNQSNGIQVDPTIAGSSGVKQPQYATITGNVCNGNVTNHGIYIQNGSHLAISGNACAGNGRDGCSVNGAYTSIAGNDFAENGRYGINLPNDTGGGNHTLGTNMTVGNPTAEVFVGSGVANVKQAVLA